MTTINDFIQTDYKDYCMYVLESRAIPSLVDGLKPSYRKALYTAVRSARQWTKTFGLIGRVISDASYHHGDQSITNVINSMTAEWNNNEPLLSGEGAFGNRFGHGAAASRYTSVKLSPAFDKFFIDNDILPAHLDPEDPEPMFYLPIIPWILVNGTSGMAIGYATKIQPRKPSDLVKAVKKLLQGKTVKDEDIPPFYASFSGTIKKNPGDHCWHQEGVYKKVAHNELVVTEIPTSYQRVSYVSHLDKLLEKGSIVDYTDGSGKSGFNFRIKFKRSSMPEDHDKIISLLGLRENLNENLTVINENGRVEVFKNAVDLMQRWLSVRLKMIDKRFIHYTNRDTLKKNELSVRSDFIFKVLKGEIVVFGKKRQDLMNDIVASGFSQEEAKKFIEIPLYHFTDDHYQDLVSKIQGLEADIEKWKTSDSNSAFLSDLNALRI